MATPLVQHPAAGSDSAESPGALAGYLRALYLLAGSFSACGLLLRYTIADQYLFFSTFYYATPWALLWAGAACSWCATAVLRWRKQAAIWLLLTVLSGWNWYRLEWRSHPPRTSADELSVLFWNTARKEDLEPAARYIAAVDADIVALVEAGGAGPDRRLFWREQCPQYDISMLGGGLILMVKGDAGRCRPGQFDYGSIYRHVPCTVRGKELHCVVVDLKSDPFYSRQPVLKQLARVVEPIQERPTLILGDFNTPVDSVHYALLREQFQEMFDVAGNGYGPTWPVPFPVLWLDQIWCNAGIEPLSCRRLPGTNSDHRPVLATFRFRD
jgi:endonuclease/exonuclease/phosphatase (EEP) superfamily protein YafD